VGCASSHTRRFEQGNDLTVMYNFLSSYGGLNILCSRSLKSADCLRAHPPLEDLGFIFTEVGKIKPTGRLQLNHQVM